MLPTQNKNLFGAHNHTDSSEESRTFVLLINKKNMMKVSMNHVAKKTNLKTTSTRYQ